MKFFVTALLLFWGGVAQAQEWQAATPESQGMDSTALARLVQYGSNVRMDALVVVRNGRIVTEAYYAPYRADMLHRINSATKAVVGTLTGIAIGRGEFPGTGTPVLDLFPQAQPADTRWQGVTVQHLLDMTSGLDWTEPLADAPPKTMLEMEQSRDWERFIFGRGMAQAPGSGFNYNSGNPHLLTVALGRKTGVPADEYARQHLFAPLGITRWRWRKDPQQVPFGGAGLYMHARDMARIGQLYLQQGQWNGRQVVPRDWAARVFAPKVDMSIPGYAYADYWWAIPKRDAYFAAGFNRQLIMVLPKLGVVAAVLGHGNWRIEDLVTHLENATRSTGPLPASPAAHDALREMASQVGTRKSLPPSAPAQLPFTRETWRIEDNRTGIRELTLDLAARTYHVKLRSREFGGALGFDGQFGEGQDAGGPVMTSASWQGTDTLKIEQRWPEEAGVMFYTLRFNGDELDFSSVNMFGVRGAARGMRVR